VWKKELQQQMETQKSSRILSDAIKSWKFFKQFVPQHNETLLVGDSVNIRIIYQLWHQSCFQNNVLTKSQIFWKNNLGVDFEMIFPKLHSIRSAPRIRNFLWKLYNKDLPIYRGQDDALCSFCHQEETTLHLFFYCSRSKLAYQSLLSLWKKWLLNPPDWVPELVLSLKFSNSKLWLILTATALWTIWKVRNEHKMNNRSLSSEEIISIYIREIVRYISARWHSFMSEQTSCRQPELFHLSMPCLQKEFLQRESLTPLIPYHFSFVNNTIVSLNQ
jgi:hypothetical protein